jgi:hypothetical protein
MIKIHTRLALGLALSLGCIGLVQAVTVTGPTPAASTRPNTNGETVTTGTVSSINMERGLLAVSGHVYRFTPTGVTFSDDRKKPGTEGLGGLKAGTKVTVRSVERDGGLQAIQVVARD